MDHQPPVVTIRPFTDDDLPAFLALATDPRVTRHVGDGTPWDPARAAARAHAATEDDNHWYSVVVDNLRWVGIVILERTADAETELGVWIHPDHWGGGVATRAASAALHAQFPAQPAAPVIAHVSADNTASRKLLSRIGFSRQSTVTGRYGTPVERCLWQIDRAPEGRRSASDAPDPSTVAPSAPMNMQQVALTVFHGRVGDHNERAAGGARVVGTALSERLGVQPVLIGTPAPSLDADWQAELAAAGPDLRAMSTRYAEVLAAGQLPVTAMTRCAVALGTVPQVSAHRPDAVVVWFDAHADLNTPANTTTGYLGGLALSGPLGWWDSGFGAGLGTDRTILVGTRDLDAAEQQRIDDGTITLVGPGPLLADRLRAAVAGRPVYVHLDCDVLEPGIAPTDYGVSGGLTLSDLELAAQVLAESPIIGLEIAEFESSSRPEGDAATAAALLEALAPLLTVA